jgi:hypothetical protein
VDGKRRWASAGGVEGCAPSGFPVLSEKRFETTGIQMNLIEKKLGGVTFLLNTNMTTNRYWITIALRVLLLPLPFAHCCS